MLKKFLIILGWLVFCAAPAQAGLESDYLKKDSTALPQKTFDLMQKQRTQRHYGDRTAGGKAKPRSAQSTRKQRRHERRVRAQQKKTEKLFGTFNQ